MKKPDKENSKGIWYSGVVPGKKGTITMTGEKLECLIEDNVQQALIEYAKSAFINFSDTPGVIDVCLWSEPAGTVAKVSFDVVGGLMLFAEDMCNLQATDSAMLKAPEWAEKLEDVAKLFNKAARIASKILPEGE